jgi:hypothetical protein
MSNDFYLFTIIYYARFLLSSSCNKEEMPFVKTENGIVTEREYIWWNKEEEYDQLY